MQDGGFQGIIRGMAEKKATTRALVRIFWSHLMRYRGAAFGLLFLIVIATLIGTLFPWLYKLLVDALTRAISGDRTKEIHTVVWIIGTILVGRFFQNALWRSAGFLASSLQPRVTTDLMRTAFRFILHKSYNFFSSTFSGSLVRHVRGFSGAFRTIFETLVWSFVPLLASSIGIIWILASRHVLLGLSVAIWLIIYVATMFGLSRRKTKVDIQRAEMESTMTGALSDAFTNNINVMLFHGHEQERERFERVTDEHQKLIVTAWRIGEWNTAITTGFTILIEAIGYAIALSLWKEGRLTVGDFVLLQGYLFWLFDQMWGLSNVIRNFYEAVADAKEMVDLMETPSEVLDKKRAKPLVFSRGKIEFKDVIFNYSQTRRVLNQFNLTISPREKIALVGPSGAGKSTIVKLLFRFYDVDRGKILIDGQSIADVTQESLHNAIALVPQEPILFHRTLKENIHYGRRDASDEEVIIAAKKAHAHEFIQQAPEGYDTLVGERGIKLSGGERQRVAIARAILKNAPILVLDEATSSLDSESESLIQDALRELMKNKTVIVIAHRLSTIMQMDRIIVVQDGKVVDMGTHDELLKKVGTYQKLWNIQAGGFGGQQLAVSS